MINRITAADIRAALEARAALLEARGAQAPDPPLIPGPTTPPTAAPTDAPPIPPPVAPATTDPPPADPAAPDAPPRLSFAKALSLADKTLTIGQYLSTQTGFAVGSTVTLAELLGRPISAASVAEATSAAPEGWESLLPSAGVEWADEIEQAAMNAGIDPRLLAAVVWAESSFRPDAVSPVGAIGLTQLMPGTAGDLGVDPHDPIQNLEGGARYLATMIDRFGSVDRALAAYNAGPGRVEEYGGAPPFTEGYIERVLGYYGELRGES